MAYAAPAYERTFGAIDRRRIGAFIATSLVHGGLLVLLISALAIPPIEPATLERVQAVAFEEVDPPELPPVETPPIREVATDAASGGETNARQVAQRPRDRLERVPLPVREPIGLPEPKFALARPTPALIGGSLTDGAGLGGRPGSGDGPGIGDAPGGTGEGLGEAARQLTTSWAPSMQMWQLHRFYPPAARMRGEAGLALLECEVIRDDRVRDCIVKDAAPVGAGFERAALRAERIYRVQVHDQDGNRVYNERVVIRAFFKPRRDAR